MPDRLRPAVLVACAAAGGVAAVLRATDGWVFAGVVLLYVAVQMVPMPTPSAVSVSPLVAAALALDTGSPILVLAAGAVSLPVAHVTVHLVHGRRTVDSRFPAEPVGVAAFAGVFFAGDVLVGPRSVDDPLVLTVFAVAAVSGFLATALARAATAQRGRAVPRRLLFLESLGDWRAYATLYASAALYAITAPVMGLWSLAVAGLPYGVGHLSLHRLQVTRNTYHQTIRALGSIPEAAGIVMTGHADRSAELAVAVGSEMGLGAPAIARVEHAALLHDLGRVVLANPAVAAGQYTMSDVAGWSAAIVGESKDLEPVAEILGVLHQPYRRPGEPRDQRLPREAQVVRVATAFDAAVAHARDPVDAIEELHRGAAYDFDPEVVLALRRVLERRGVIAG